MNLVICNAFSLSMLSIPLSGSTKINVKSISLSEAKDIVKNNSFISAVGHADTAAILSNILEANIDCNRINVTLTSDNLLLVAQYFGPRLPEGTTILPEGSTFRFYLVSKN